MEIVEFVTDGPRGDALVYYACVVEKSTDVSLNSPHWLR